MLADFNLSALDGLSLTLDTPEPSPFELLASHQDQSLCLNQVTGRNWSLIQGDCCELIKSLPNDSVHFTVYSPPFASLYVYSNSERDMGNAKDYDEFGQHYAFLIRELLRVTKPGRLCSVHCMNLPTSISHHGQIGIQDFRGDIIREHVGSEAAELHAAMKRIEYRMEIAQTNHDIRRFANLDNVRSQLLEDLRNHPPKDGGWIYHSEVCVWKDPVTAMQRTKALGLLHKQIKKDSCMSRQGIPDYVVTFRKPGKNPEPVEGEFDRWIGDESFQSAGQDRYEKDLEEYQKYLNLKTDDERHEWADCGGPTEPPTKSKSEAAGGTKLSIDVWQRFASPVWMDINATRTLQYMQARHEDDERHICPLQLDVIERCMEMWSNPGDVVLSPFAGIGSEGYVSVLNGRKHIGFELKDTYFAAAVKNLRVAEQEARDKSRTLMSWAEGRQSKE